MVLEGVNGDTMIGINFLMRFVTLGLQIAVILVVLAVLLWLLANVLGLAAGSFLRAPFEFLRRTVRTLWHGLFK